jgi:hypothetical protein
MSGSNSALAVMDDDRDGDDGKSNDYSTRKEKFYAINQDIAKLVAEEQIAAATDGTSILSVITECKARVLRLLKDPNRQEYFPSNIESSDAFLRSHTHSKANLVILYADLVGSTHEHCSRTQILDYYLADIHTRNEYYGDKKSWIYLEVCWGCSDCLFSYN